MERGDLLLSHTDECDTHCLPQPLVQHLLKRLLTSHSRFVIVVGVSHWYPPGSFVGKLSSSFRIPDSDFPHIEHHLLAISKGNNTLKRLDVFTHVLSSGDFARLEQEPVTLHKQACLAITLYEQRLETSLPEKIKEKIFQLYEE